VTTAVFPYLTFHTSNVASVPRSEAQAHVCLAVRGAPGECYYNTISLIAIIFHRRVWYDGIARFLCAMRVFEVRTLSSSPRVPLRQISFLSRSPLLS